MRAEIGAIAVAGAVVGSALLAWAGDARAEGPAPPAAMPQKLALELNHSAAGWVQSVEGGHATSDVVSEKVGPDHVVHKHIAGVKYEDITVSCGTGMSKGFYEWIKASFSRTAARPDLSLHAVDANGKIASTIDFFKVLVTEVAFPPLDVASKDAAKMTIKFAAEAIQTKLGDQKVAPALAPITADKRGFDSVQDKWGPGTLKFQFDFAKCGAACGAAYKLSSFFVRVGVNENGPPTLDASNFKVLMPPTAVKEWGAKGDAREGSLVYRSGDGAPLAAFRFSNMKLMRAAPAPNDPQSVEVEIAPGAVSSSP